MVYFCGILSCKNKCGKFPDCHHCKDAEYTQAGSPEVICRPDPTVEVEE